MTHSGERIETMRTFWTAYGHEPDPVAVATAQLRKRKVEVRRDLHAFGIAPTAQAKLLEAALGDPNKPVDAPVRAYVNNGRWIADCGHCNGAEVVDDVSLLFMCGSCMNTTHGHRWRLVVMPEPPTRAAIELILLARPSQRNRNWRPDESLAQLAAENVERGVWGPGDGFEIPAQEGGVTT